MGDLLLGLGGLLLDGGHAADVGFHHLVDVNLLFEGVLLQAFDSFVLNCVVLNSSQREEHYVWRVADPGFVLEGSISVGYLVLAAARYRGAESS